MGYEIIASFLIFFVYEIAVRGENNRRFRIIPAVLAGILMSHAIFNTGSGATDVVQNLPQLDAKDIETCKQMRDFVVVVATERDKGVPKPQAMKITDEKFIAPLAARTSMTPAQRDLFRAAILGQIAATYGAWSSLTPEQIGDSIVGGCREIKAASLEYGNQWSRTGK